MPNDDLQTVYNMKAVSVLMMTFAWSVIAIYVLFAPAQSWEAPTGGLPL
jgi:hypothetical protein